MPSSTPKPGTGISGIYFADGRGTVLDFTGIVVATTGDRFTVEFHGGHRQAYYLSTEIDFWERTERALGYVAKWIAEFGHHTPDSPGEFERAMQHCGRRPNTRQVELAMHVLALPRDRVERLMAPFADA